MVNPNVFSYLPVSIWVRDSIETSETALLRIEPKRCIYSAYAKIQKTLSRGRLDFMRKTMNISLSTEMYEYVRKRARYRSVSEYVRGLILADQRRSSERDKIVRKIQTANESGTCGRVVMELRRVIEILEGREPDLNERG